MGRSKGKKHNRREREESSESSEAPFQVEKVLDKRYDYNSFCYEWGVVTSPNSLYPIPTRRTTDDLRRLGDDRNGVSLT